MVGLLYFQEIALCLSTLLMLIPWIILLDRIENLREFKIYILLLLGLLTRLIYAPFFGHSYDIEMGLSATDDLLQGKSPYYEDPYYNHPHGPLEYLTLTLVIFLLGRNYFAFKLASIVSEVVLGFLIYKISIEYTSNERLAFWAAALFLTNPWTYFQTVIVGHLDAMPTLFMVLTVYLLIKERPKFSALALGCGVMYKLFPIVILPVVVLYLARQKRWKHIIEYILITVTIASIISLPFLILSFDYYISVLLATGGIRGLSIYRVLFYSVPRIGISINTRLVSTAIMGTGMIIALLIFMKRRVTNLKIGLLEESTFFFLIFILLNRYLSEHYIVWTIPFLVIYFLIKPNSPQLVDMVLYYSYTCAVFFYRVVKWRVWFSLYDDLSFVFFSAFMVSILFWHLIGWLIAIRFFRKNLPSEVSDLFEKIFTKLRNWLHLSEKKNKLVGLRSYITISLLQIDFSIIYGAIIIGILTVMFIFQGKTDVSFEEFILPIMLLSLLTAALLRIGLLISGIRTSNAIYTFINFWIIYIFEVGIYFHTDILTILTRSLLIALSSSLGYILISLIENFRHRESLIGQILR